MFSLFDFGKMSSLVALIIGSAWVAVDNNFIEGVFFMFAGFVIIIILFVLEKTWVEHKHDSGIIE